mmetsp:Transcript_1430/g.1921  ORF Transcript_1430/g.1921 Transcript_1430/m.1921 type:complete len:1240 (+) Transcript_1430:30-3749(+)
MAKQSPQKNHSVINKTKLQKKQAKSPGPPLPETCPSFRRNHVPSVRDVTRLQNLSKPHVESFDFFLASGVDKAINDIPISELDISDPKNPDVNLDEVSTVHFWVENVAIKSPLKAESTRGGTGSKLTPRECRELGLMYSGLIMGDFCCQIVQRRNGIKIKGRIMKIKKHFGNMPIMVMSKACHLKGKTPAELANMREEQNEFGGYFIVNGIERCVRLLQIPRRNHPTAIQRSNYKNRGPTYTDLGVAIRCSRYCGDQTSITNTVHYLTTGSATIKFLARKQEFLIPVIIIIRALSGGSLSDSDAFDPNDGRAGRIGITDEELYKRIVQNDQKNTFLRARAELLLQEARARYGDLNTPAECLAYLGERCRNLSQRAESTSDIEIGHYMISRFILIHLPSYKDKLECLIFLLRKLYAFAVGDCGIDNADSLQNQEILLPGHLLTSFVKEKFEEMLQALRQGLVRELRLDYGKASGRFSDAKYWSRLVDRHGSLANGGIGKKVQHLLSTGNVISTSGLDLMQVSGFTIVAERLNFLRYCAHFRSVHRGQFFMEMKTTAVRKLLPDQWGFLCPVHTPDGGPCGLLSHLALKCSVLSYPSSTSTNCKVDLPELLISLGVSPLGAGGENGDGRASSIHNYLPVCLDGKVIGGAPMKLCRSIATHLRKLKVAEKPQIPQTLEVALIPTGNSGGPYPGLYMFTGAARLVRPVLHRATGKIELIGPMEQPFLDIACLDMDIREGITTHQELDPTNMLSLIASLTPFSDYNQSPRNMYQCQMGKQTMGTPAHSLPFRTDNKLYRLQNPQAPVVQTSRHGEFKMDEYPNGTNAVVAVLSYTGFDMEDAMILNKGSFERGFGHASVYKTVQVDLAAEAKMASSSTKNEHAPSMKFGNASYQNLGNDGFPEIGTYVEKGDPIYCVVDEVSGRDRVTRHKERERAYIQHIRLLGSENGKIAENKASITMRFNRNPVIGDKFSSRHGQKGVLSILWPQEDMPFSESGITPDVIINPHAFPSRMTIGMLIESMAGKSGALHGLFQDATPFSFHESGDKLAVDYFGEQLQMAGYNYYGSEPLYSGVSGCLMQADLYIGVVFYQRLRHMVSDKYQVRATGPVNQLTRQPIKGRKKGGGIRLGEMERDSLLSHGTAFLLHDRLLNCSDKHVAYACNRCGDLLSPTTERNTVLSTGQGPKDSLHRARLRLFCRNAKCRDAVKQEGGNDEAVEPIILPYIYRYLVNEMAAMNVKMTLEIR